MYKAGGPLLVPEIGNDPLFARYFYDVLGAQAIGIVPFGIDYTGYSNFPLGARNIDEAIEAFARPYRLLAPMAREWARLSFEKRVWGAGEPDDHTARKFELGRWTATLAFNEWQFGMKQWFPQGTPIPDWAPYPSGGALLAELGPDEFLLTGQRVRVNFAPAADRKVNGLIFASVEEGEYRDGKWTRTRIWNGDQTDYGLNLTDEPRRTASPPRHLLNGDIPRFLANGDGPDRRSGPSPFARKRGMSPFQIIQPPSMTWIWPVVKPDSSLARCSASAAISSGLPSLPMGWRASNSARVFA